MTSSTWTSVASTWMIPRAFSERDCCEERVPEHICARTSLLRSPASRAGVVSSSGSGRFMVFSLRTTDLNRDAGSYSVTLLCPLLLTHQTCHGWPYLVGETPARNR